MSNASGPLADPLIGPGRVLSFTIAPGRPPTIHAATDVIRRPDGAVLAAVTGPGPTDADGLLGWLERGSPDPAPQRQGFVALLWRPDGHTTIAVSARVEVGLFYALGDGCILGSSTMPALVARMPGCPSVNLQKLADLNYDYDDAFTTWFEGVHRLPPGHMIDLHGGGSPRVRKWFDPQPIPMRDRIRSSAGQQMREAVQDAVAASLPASGDVAVSLSGGLDSTMIAATAASMLHPLSRQVHGYTHVPLPGLGAERPGWLASDESAVRCLAMETPGLSFEAVITPIQRTPFDALLDQFPTTFAPLRNTGNAPWLLHIRHLADAARFPLVFTGMTGNLTFSWSAPTAIEELKAAGEIRAAWRLATVNRTNPRSVGQMVPQAVRWLRSRLLPAQVVSWRPEDYLRHPPSTTIGQRPFNDANDWRQALTVSASMRGAIQAPGSVAWRSDPLSDPEVVRLAMNIHPTAWYDRATRRAVARESMRGLVPDEVRLRSDRGMQSADGHVRHRVSEDRMTAMIDVIASSATARQLVDPDALRASLRESPGDGWSRWNSWVSGPGRALGYALFAAWWEGFRHGSTTSTPPNV